MKRQRSNRRLATLAGTALAVLIVEALSPASAVASCGDYVTFANQQQGRSGSHQRPCTKPDQRCPYQTMPGKAPCQGAECSKGEVPPLVPPTVSPPSMQEFACLGIIPRTVESPTHFRQAERDVVSPSHLADPVFRPPRAV